MPPKKITAATGAFSVAWKIYGLYVLAMPLYCLARMAVWPSATAVLTVAIPCLLAMAMFAAAVETRGWLHALALFGCGFTIALGSELVGSGSGYIFGRYTYTAQLGWRLFGLVPVLIPMAWAGMLYPAWHVAGLLLRRFIDLPFQPLWRCVLAAAAMTAWDLSLDPRMVADGHWIWAEPGVYFGIPLSNYAGWFVTALTVYCAWTALDRILNMKIGYQAQKLFSTETLPLLAYCVVWIGESLANVAFWAGPAVGLAVFVAMGLFAVPTLRFLSASRAH